MYMNILSACMCGRSKEGIRSPETSVVNGCELPCGCCKQNLDSVRATVLQAAESYFQPPFQDIKALTIQIPKEPNKKIFLLPALCS